MQRILKSRRGQVLFDCDRIEPPSEHWFDPDWWERQSAIVDRHGGRGEALSIRTPVGQAVLKQYYRGGKASLISHSSYLYLGTDRVRSIREWQITNTLWQAGLPVPEPLAAWFERRGIRYRAALITREIEDTQTLADYAGHTETDPALWHSVGQIIHRFAAFGLFHPDLNANNILINGRGQLWLIDFDKSSLKADAIQSTSMLERLVRSLDKLTIKYDADALGKGAGRT